MRLFAATLALIPFLTFSGCPSRTVPPQQTPSATSLGKVESDKDSKISAFAEGTEVALNTMPDSPAKTAAFESNSVVRRLAGPATEKDRVEAQKLVNQALSGKLSEALAGFAKARNDADSKNAEIEALKKKIEAERIRYNAEQEEKLKKQQRFWQTIIFMGGGLVSTMLGIATLILVANPATAITYVFLGPKLGWCLIGAGLGSIALGIAINAIENLIERHPWIFGGALALALGLGLIAAVLTYANHSNHHNDVRKPSGNP